MVDTCGVELNICGKEISDFFEIFSYILNFLTLFLFWWKTLAVCASMSSNTPNSLQSIFPLCVPHKHMVTQTSSHTLPAVDGRGVSWISLYNGENWPNSPNYGITWTNLIHHCNYWHQLPHTQKNTHTLTPACEQTQTLTSTLLLWQQKVLI